MDELEFTLRLNSPGFLGEVPRGRKKVHYVARRNRETKKLEERSETVDHYPVSPCGLRIPTLRGLLAFWHRALLGGLSSEEVYDRQGRLFGSVDHGQGVTFRPAGRPSFRAEELDFGRDEDPYAHVYMGYGPLQVLKIRDPDVSPEIQGIDIATSHNRTACRDVVRVESDTPPRFPFVVRGRPEQLDELLRALTLFHLFGGAGARSRRGWGSIAVEAEGIPSAPPAKELVSWMTDEVAKVFGKGDLPQGRPGFSALSRASRIRVTTPLDGGWDAVLLELYRRFQEVRLWGHNNPSPPPTARNDHSLEAKDAGAVAAKALSGVPRRLAFGLPYSPRFQRGPQIEYRGQRPPGAHDPDARKVTRRASPLILKVLRLEGDKHAGVALFLDAPFFSDTKLEVGAKHKELTRPFPGYDAVREYLDCDRWREVPLP